MPAFLFEPGTSPLLVSMPHVGTHIPEGLAAEMTEAAQEVPDTDWHVDRLYDFLLALGASVLRAVHSRYVIDLNRPPSGESLYPGARNTELCPTSLFDDRPIYRPGRAPDAAAVAERRAVYWQPYHERLAAELAAIKARHGYALLFDAHSIRSHVPRFFEGRLWDINLGTGDGLSAYVVYEPRCGKTDGDRNMISNIHARGTPIEDAASRLAEFAAAMIEQRTSGVTLDLARLGEAGERAPRPPQVRQRLVERGT